MSTNLYVDSSVIISLLFEEAGSQKYKSLINKNKHQIFSASLLEAEIYATARREEVPLEKAAGFVDLVSLVFPDRSLQGEYMTIFQKGFLRGADAYHVATALYIDREIKNLYFITADQKQEQIAKAIGFKVI